MIPLQPYRSEEPDERDSVAVLVHGRETVLLTVEEAEQVAAGLLAVVIDIKGP